MKSKYIIFYQIICIVNLVYSSDEKFFFYPELGISHAYDAALSLCLQASKRGIARVSYKVLDTYHNVVNMKQIYNKLISYKTDSEKDLMSNYVRSVENLVITEKLLDEYLSRHEQINQKMKDRDRLLTLLGITRVESPAKDFTTMITSAQYIVEKDFLFFLGFEFIAGMLGRQSLLKCKDQLIGKTVSQVFYDSYNIKLWKPFFDVKISNWSSCLQFIYDSRIYMKIMLGLWHKPEQCKPLIEYVANDFFQDYNQLSFLLDMAHNFNFFFRNYKKINTHFDEAYCWKELEWEEQYVCLEQEKKDIIDRVKRMGACGKIIEFPQILAYDINLISKVNVKNIHSGLTTLKNYRSINPYQSILSREEKVFQAIVKPIEGLLYDSYQIGYMTRKIIETSNSRLYR